ncbi:MAG: hypothetical protein ACHQZQ_00700 [SAR324 cluster bacterium]
MKRSVRRAAGRRLPGEAARARGAARRRAGAGLGAVLLAASLASFVPMARGAQDDMVPEGVFRFQVSETYETQTTATARDGKIHDLAVYALPDPNDATQVSGTLWREIYQTDLQLQFGLTDRWNVSLAVPYVQAVQHSTLRVNNNYSSGGDSYCNASSSPPCDLAATVANLQSRTLAGFGNYRLTSLHRPVFTDANALTWGWGLNASLESNAGVYTGDGSLQTRDPYGSLFSMIHYTHYPELARSRVDIRMEYVHPLVDKVTLPTGQRVSILGGPQFLTSIGWEHEPGSWGYGFRIDQKNTLQTELAGESQDDPVKEWIFHAQLGYGNLIQLENAPIHFPFQVSLTWDITFSAYNAPMRDRWGLTYFTYY